MAKINLLPWRAERRKARQQEFMTMLGAASIAAVLVTLMIVLYYNGQIDGQNNRNKYLTDQIALLNTQIAEIELLDQKKAGLLKRKQVIEDLQARRSQMVHLFDELARTIADGTQIVTLQQNGAELSLSGRAQSNARVSTYMRNLSASGWMANPDLSIIELRGANPALPSEFQLKVALKDPNAPAADGSVPADATAAAGPDAAAGAGAGATAPTITPPTSGGAAPGATPAPAPGASAPPATSPAPGPDVPPTANPEPPAQPPKPATPAGGTP